MSKNKPSKKDEALTEYYKEQEKEKSIKKFSREYYINLVDDVFKEINWSEVNDVRKSYSHKPHLASLPYDRSKGRTSSELFERYNACLDGMAKTRDTLNDLRKQSKEALDDYRKNQHEKEDLVEQYKSMREDNQRFFDAESKVLEERKRVLDNIRDTMNLDVSIKEELYDRINGLEKYFNSGWINQGNQSVFQELANDIIDWRYSIEKDDNQWGKTVDGIADDIRVLGDNEFFDKDLPKLYENTHDEGVFADLIDKIDNCQKGMDDAHERGDATDKELKKQENIFSDYFIESEKTKLSYVQTGVLDDKVAPGKKETWIKNQKQKIQQMEEEL